MTDPLSWLDLPLPFPIFGPGERVVAAVGIRRRHYIALAGMAAELEGYDGLRDRFAVYLTAEERQRVLAAVAAALVEDAGAAEALDEALAAVTMGPPPTALTTIAAEARDWVAWASEAERKRYLLELFKALPRPDRVKFLAAAQRVALS